MTRVRTALIDSTLALGEIRLTEGRAAESVQHAHTRVGGRPVHRTGAPPGHRRPDTAGRLPGGPGCRPAHERGSRRGGSRPDRRHQDTAATNRRPRPCAGLARPDAEATQSHPPRSQRPRPASASLTALVQGDAAHHSHCKKTHGMRIDLTVIVAPGPTHGATRPPIHARPAMSRRHRQKTPSQRLRCASGRAVTATAQRDRPAGGSGPMPPSVTYEASRLPEAEADFRQRFPEFDPRWSAGAPATGGVCPPRRRRTHLPGLHRGWPARRQSARCDTSSCSIAGSWAIPHSNSPASLAVDASSWSKPVAMSWRSSTPRRMSTSASSRPTPARPCAWLASPIRSDRVARSPSPPITTTRSMASASLPGAREPWSPTSP